MHLIKFNFRLTAKSSSLQPTGTLPLGKASQDSLGEENRSTLERTEKLG